MVTLYVLVHRGTPIYASERRECLSAKQTEYSAWEQANMTVSKVQVLK